MRARYPDREGVVERNGEQIFFEVYDRQAPTILLTPTWEIVHSRHWKFMIPFLARHYRVVTYDPVGNGRSTRSTDPNRYTDVERMADAVAILDATETASCLVVGWSAGGRLVTLLAALHGDRVDGAVAISPSHPWVVPIPGRESIADTFTVDLDDPQGWEKFNSRYWQREWLDFAEFFFGEAASDPHSTKGWDDMVGWSQETTGDVIAATVMAPVSIDVNVLEAAVRAIDVPFLVVQGTADRLRNPKSSSILADMIPDAELVWLDGAGHAPTGRFPVRINHLIKTHADSVYIPPIDASRWHIGHSRAKRALMISSPIGLGHARRDVAIIDELRKIHPDLEVDWLAQDPVTRVLDANGERIHPASSYLANESSHMEDLAGEHDLAVFQALRDMDEIQVANFMLINEVLADGQYDVVIGDEAWELDYHLHENSNLKETPYVWLTDFVGYLPMPERGEREAFVTADYNAEMIEQVARHPTVRDRAIFVGAPEDIVPDRFGPDLPLIKEWTEANYDFAGYITGFDPSALGDRDELRAELGYHPDHKVCIVSVGGSAVGIDLLRRVITAYPAAADAVDDLRMIIVAGPRIDPSLLPQIEGIEYRTYVDRLYRHLAVADLAVVQGGLTTTMELTACKVPFLYLPLRNHFEQNFHVRTRLDRYNAGQFLDYQNTDPDALAASIATNIGRQVQYRDVETDGAKNAARTIGDLL